MPRGLGILNRHTGPHARQHAAASLRNTLRHTVGRSEVSEADLRTAWLRQLSLDPSIVSSGWYDPPPSGIAVIADDPATPQRISFTSLRLAEFWPTDRLVNFRNDLLYCYSSPVSRADLWPGDLAVTLYFGKEERILAHFTRCLSAVTELLALASTVETSCELYALSAQIFGEYELSNEVVSITDEAQSDIGHSLPRLDSPVRSELSADQRAQLRARRRFLNACTRWLLAEETWFTVEPQLRSALDRSLPQISFHFVCSTTGGELHATEDVIRLYAEFMPLLPIPSIWHS